MAGFEWTLKRSKAAILLAEGLTKQQIATELRIGERTLYNWLTAIEFSAEVDRLTLMLGIASRAERMRIAKRVIASKIGEDGSIDTSKDILDWIKFAQSETDGIKLDLAALHAAFSKAETPVADEGQT